MQSEWTTKTLSEVATDVTVGFVGTMADQYVPSGIPFLRSLNVKPFGIDLGEVKFIAPEFHARLRKSALAPGDVVIVRTGKPGTCAVVPPSLPDANCSDVVIVRCGPTLRPHFLCYWVNTMAGSHVDAHTVGAVQQHFNVASAKKLRLPVPPLEDQDAVLIPLRAIDQRIDLLRQTNATLESIAQTLFKSWFIDFDPVRAKAEGREPEGMDAATAAFFPAEFEGSELGEIPKGWPTGTVHDLFVLQRGFDLPAADREAGDFTVFAASGPHGKHKEAMVKGPGVTTGRSGVLGRVFYSHDDFWPLNTSLWVKEYKLASAPFAYQFLQTLDLHRLNAGSAVPTLNRNHVHALPVVLPSVELVETFTSILEPLLRKQRQNEVQESCLIDLRETLLPRLISGKLRLPEAQELCDAS